MPIRFSLCILVLYLCQLCNPLFAKGNKPEDMVNKSVKAMYFSKIMTDKSENTDNRIDSMTHPQNIYYLIKGIHISENKKINYYTEFNSNQITTSTKFDFIKIDFDTTIVSDTLLEEVIYTLIKGNNKIIIENKFYNDYIILSRLKSGKYRLYMTYLGAGDKVLYYTDIIGITITESFGSGRISIVLYILTGLLFLSFLLRLQSRAFRRITRQFRERDILASQLMKQKEELAIKNKNITDSINYAKRIQTAMLPSERLFKTLFPQAFILLISKDIVSGDFYWINEVDDTIFIAAVDCTGHGVPGAFMSIIGFELFRKLTNIQKIKHPSEILNSLNNDFREIFRDVEDINLKDGMDLAFCTIDKKRSTLEFAGAFNPLYLIRNNSIIEIKADRYSIGLDSEEEDKHLFTNHKIKLQQGDVFYIFSDGYVDQFGGPEGKKYKYRRFRHLLLALHQLPMNKQHDFLNKSIMEWKGELDQVDDILVIGVKVDF